MIKRWRMLFMENDVPKSTEEKAKLCKRDLAVRKRSRYGLTATKPALFSNM
jgi:hypothetical protein